MAGAADYDEACNAADGAGQGHGADDYLLHIDSGVPGRVFALSHYRNLISLLAVLQVDEDGQGQRQHDYQVPAVLQAEQLWKPSPLCGGVDGSHRVGSLWILPENDAVCDDLHGHIVHHQCKQCLVGVPVCLKKCRDGCPDHG